VDAAWPAATMALANRRAIATFAAVVGWIPSSVVPGA
jgi:hypothetical protein